MTIIWHLYGGHDFKPPSSPTPSYSPSPNSSPLNPKRQTHNHSSSSSPRFPQSRNIPSSHQQPIPQRARSGSGGGLHYKKGATGYSPNFQKGSSGSSAGAEYVKIPSAKNGRGKGTKGGCVDWKTAGGLGRNHDVLVEIELDKVLQINKDLFSLV